ESQVLEEELVAVLLLQPRHLDDVVAEARARRDLDLGEGLLLPLSLVLQVLEGGQARLGLAPPRRGRGAHPLQLALYRALLAGLFTLLLGGALGLLLQPGRVVALVGDAL